MENSEESKKERDRCEAFTMEDIRKLYEERRMTELEKMCVKKETAGEADFYIYALHACTMAAENSLSRLSLGKGIELFKEAAVLCADNEEQGIWLYRNYTGEVLMQLGRTERIFAGISKTPDIVNAYRGCMRLSADALEAAAGFGDGIQGTDTLEIKKKAALCMVRLCAVYKYEIDMGKNILNRMDNASDDVRKDYNERYDRIVEDIRKNEPEYVPEEIQRERAVPDLPDRKKKVSKSPIERLRELFREEKAR